MTSKEIDNLNLKMIEVESSNIAAIGHRDNKLFVNFKNGSLYSYDGVEKELLDEMLKADSKGKFLNREIKGRYNYLKLASDWSAS